jgi:hypothetical protein
MWTTAGSMRRRCRRRLEPDSNRGGLRRGARADRAPHGAQPATSEGDRLDLLTTPKEAHEAAYHPLEATDPLAALGKPAPAGSGVTPTSGPGLARSEGSISAPSARAARPPDHVSV